MALVGSLEWQALALQGLRLMMLLAFQTDERGAANALYSQRFCQAANAAGVNRACALSPGSSTVDWRTIGATIHILGV